MLEPRSILITGAAGAIGSALACVYAKPGVFLHLGDVDEKHLREVVVCCQTLGAEVHGSVVDVTEAPAMQAWINAADSLAPLDLILAIPGVPQCIICFRLRRR
jgi:NADP-dependent 3-hydroxy acid dehydrogenase YdfG